LSREIGFELPGAEAVFGVEGHTCCAANGEVQRDLARSHDETPSMRGSTMRENRDTLRLPTADGAVGRGGKSEDTSHR
jgi:hypothetical protein